MCQVDEQTSHFTFHAKTAATAGLSYNILQVQDKTLTGRNMVPPNLSLGRAAFAVLLTAFFFPGVLSCPEKCECKETPPEVSIDCSNRNLTSVPLYSGPESITNVSYLDLDSNQIAEINIGDFQSYPEIRSLSLGSNKLTSIPEAVSDLTSLESLFLQGNNFGNLTPEKAFAKLTRLKLLWLGGCGIRSLPDNVFGEDLMELTAMDIRGNSLNDIPTGALQSLNALVDISLQENNFQSIKTGALSGMRSLDIVWLSQNPIETIEANAFSHENLRSLQMTICQISTLMPGAFSGMPRLSELNMYDNRIEDLTGSGIEQVLNLSSLDVSKNRLGNLPDNFFDLLSNIDKLVLYNNEMTDFPVSSLANATQGRKMQELNINGNPLPCSLKAKIESAVNVEKFTFPSTCVPDEVSTKPTTTPTTATTDNASAKIMSCNCYLLMSLAFLLSAVISYQ